MTTETTQAWSDRPLADLLHYLSAKHHQFVRDELVAIALRLSDLCTSASAADPEILSLRYAFSNLSEKVLPHLHHEEENFFPAVEALEKAWESREPFTVPNERGLAQSVQLLTEEHAGIALRLDELREARARIAASGSLSVRCASVLAEVAALEAHLRNYMMLEDTMVFTRARALEEQILFPLSPH